MLGLTASTVFLDRTFQQDSLYCRQGDFVVYAASPEARSRIRQRAFRVAGRADSSEPSGFADEEAVHKAHRACERPHDSTFMARVWECHHPLAILSPGQVAIFLRQDSLRPPSGFVESVQCTTNAYYSIGIYGFARQIASGLARRALTVSGVLGVKDD